MSIMVKSQAHLCGISKLWGGRSSQVASLAKALSCFEDSFRVASPYGSECEPAWGAQKRVDAASCTILINIPAKFNTDTVGDSDFRPFR